MKILKHLVISIAVYSGLLFVIYKYIPGLQFFVEADGYGIVITFLLLGGVLRFLNNILKKVLKIVTLPLKVLTLGISSLIINIAIFYIFEWLINTADIGIKIQIGTSGVDKLIIIAILALIITTVHMILKKLFK